MPKKRQSGAKGGSKWTPKSAQNREKRDSEGVPNSIPSFDLFLGISWGGLSGPNVALAISNSHSAGRPKAGFWSYFGVHFGSLLGSFSSFSGSGRLPKNDEKMEAPK